MEKSQDQRFAKIRNDPRFKPLPQHKKKVQIDRRFEGMFKDPKFKLKYQVDKRGRPITLSSNDHLKRYYDLDSSEDTSDSDLEDDKDEDKSSNKAIQHVNQESKLKSKKEMKMNEKVAPLEKALSTIKENKGKNASVDEIRKDSRKMKGERKNSELASESTNLKGRKASQKTTDGESRSENEANKKTGKDKLKSAKPLETFKKKVEKKVEEKKGKGKSAKLENMDESTDEESVSEDEIKQKNKKEKTKVRKLSNKKTEESSDEASDSDENDGESALEDVSDEEGVKNKLQDLTLDYARGEGVFATDSSDDSDASAAEDEEEEEVAHPWGELDADAERTEEVSSRLAICNMDWDRIHAVDLMVLLNSFVPQNASIKSVAIYPSEFGLERMKEEELRGPKEIVETKVLSSDEEDESGDEYQTEKLRQYQLNRLKYYYAVAIFDSRATAAKVYEECDGMEYESSATKLDLRFIPDDMEFEHAPKEECTALPDLTRYEPKFFVNTALQQAQVQLTWEENDPQRKANMEKLFDASKKKGTEVDENIIRQYLATSSSEGEESGIDDVGSDAPDENLDSVAKYRALLADIDKPEKEDKDMGMEITWGVGLKEKAEKLVEKKLSGKDKLTPWEQYLEKKKEKKRQKKEKLKATEESQTEEEDMDDIPSDVDLNDPYFREEFENNPDFKPVRKSTKGKKAVEEVVDSDSDQSDQKKAELELLLDDNDDGRKHFSLKKIMKNEEQNKKKKGKRKEELEASKQEDDFSIKVDDPRFSALFSSHHYSVDPSDPNFKKTKAMEAILAEKQKRRIQEPGSTDTPPAKQAKTEEKKMDHQLSNLVRNLKSKVNTAKLKSSKKF